MKKEDLRNPDDLKNEKHDFESNKIISLNKFFMNHAFLGLILTFLLFVVSVVLLMLIISASNIDVSVRITIISMIATFILTTSKALIDRIIEVVVYIMRLLGEEQRGLSKKMGIEIDDVDFETIKEVENKEN